MGDTLTLYATNDEESTESIKTIQVETEEVDRIYSTYLKTTEFENMPSALYQDNDEKQNQVKVKSCFAPVVTPIASQDQDSALYKASLAQGEAVDASLNSSGYTSANSPVVSISPVDTPSVERTITPDPLSINIHSHVLGNSQTRDEVPPLYVSPSIKEASISEANQIMRISQVQGSANSVVVSALWSNLGGHVIIHFSGFFLDIGSMYSWMK